MHVIIYQRLKVLVCKQIKTNIDMNMTDCEVKIEIHYFVKEILSVLKWCVWYKTSNRHGGKFGTLSSDR